LQVAVAPVWLLLIGEAAFGRHAPIDAWVVRIWEPEAPEDQAATRDAASGEARGSGR